MWDVMNTERLNQIVEATRDAAGHLRHLDLTERITEHIDDRMLEMARQIGATSTGDFLEVVSEQYLEGLPRPDAVDHHKAYLTPNPISTADQLAVLGIVDVMQAGQVGSITARFAEFCQEEKLFDRLADGAEYVFPTHK